MKRTIKVSAAVLSALVIVGAPLPVLATNAYDFTGATNVAVNPYHGSAGFVFEVSTPLQLDQLGIMANTTAATMDADAMWTRLWLLNDPTGDVSDATLLAEVNFDVGLAAASGLHNTWWYLYLQDPDTGAGVALTPGNTYVISNTTDDTPSRTMMSVPNSAVVGSEITHLQSRWGTAGSVPTNNDGAVVSYGGPTFTYHVGGPEPDHFDRPGQSVYAAANLGSGLTSTFGVGTVANSDAVTISDLDGLSAAATHTIDITALPGIGTGVFPLLDYDGTIGGDGFGAFTLGALPHMQATLVDNTIDGRIDLDVTSVGELFWDGDAGNSNWDTDTTANWLELGGGSSETFLGSDSAGFDDSATVPGGTITVVGTVEPREVFFENDTSAYTLVGGTISSPGGLEKTGSGDVILLNDNSFETPSLLDVGVMTVGDGTTGSFDGDIDITVGAELVLNLPDGSSWPDTITGNGALTKAGSGTLTLTQNSASFGGATAVNAGTLWLDAAASLQASPITVANGATLVAGVQNALQHHASTILVESGGTLDSATATASNIGAGANTLILEGGATLAGAVPDPTWGSWIINTAGAVVDVAGGSATAATISAEAVNVAGSKLTLSVDDVTGDAATDLLVSGTFGAAAVSAFDIDIDGGGTVEMNGVNTYTGRTTVFAGSTLAGTGVLPGPVDLDGTVSPGGSTGTLGTGTLVVYDGGTYACEIDGATSDSIAVTGDLDLDASATDELVITELSPATADNYIIATCTGTLWGTFGTVTGLPTGYSIVYDDINGRIYLTTGVSSYSLWVGGFGLAGPDADPDADPDLDSIPNSVEYVIGGDPSVASLDGLPTGSTPGAHFVYTFERDDASETPDTTVTIEMGTTLQAWPDVYVVGADTGSSSPGVTIVENGTDPDTVTLTVPRAPDAAKFGRLRVEIAP